MSCDNKDSPQCIDVPEDVAKELWKKIDEETSIDDNKIHEKVQAPYNLFVDSFRLHLPPQLCESPPPAWADFLTKCTRSIAELLHRKDQCETEAWKSRKALTDPTWTDLDMLFAARKIKDKGNVEFNAADFDEALKYYILANRLFPLPDTMLNAAACALKTGRFFFAEEQCNDALLSNLITKPATFVKAFYRRSQARRYLGKFTDAVKDMKRVIKYSKTATKPDTQEILFSAELQLTQNLMLEYLSATPRLRAVFEEKVGKALGPRFHVQDPALYKRYLEEHQSAEDLEVGDVDLLKVLVQIKVPGRKPGDIDVEEVMPPVF